VDDKFERMRKKAVITGFKALSHYLLGQTEENPQNLNQ